MSANETDRDAVLAKVSANETDRDAVLAKVNIVKTNRDTTNSLRLKEMLHYTVKQLAIDRDTALAIKSQRA